MRIPFPKAVPLWPLVMLLTVLLCIQLIQGTDPSFAVLMLIAQIAAAAAFNCMGGMTHMAGAFCLFAVLPTVTVPEIAHLLLGQAGDLNLVNPITTAGVCAVFFICVMIAALFVSSMSHPMPLLDHVQFSMIELRIVSALSCVFAISIAFKLLTLKGVVENGSLLATLSHFYAFLLAISVMMATYVRVILTGGKSVMDWYIAFLLILAVIPGIMSASKEGILMPLLCWLVVVGSSGHRFSWYGTLGLAAVLFVMWTYVYPFSQNARSPVRDAGSISEKVNLIVEFFRDPSQFPDSIATSSASTEFGVATAKVNIVARYSVLPSIDMLIDADEKVGYTSIDRYAPVLLSVVPHVLWPNRPATITSNELGHKAGFALSPGDSSTGIAIGSPGLFFDLGGWVALIVYTLLCFVIFFLLAIRVVGNSSTSIWGLVVTGTEGNFAGNASPASMFSMAVMYLGTFVLTVAALKLISYIAEAVISRPIAAKYLT